MRTCGDGGAAESARQNGPAVRAARGADVDGAGSVRGGDAEAGAEDGGGVRERESESESQEEDEDEKAKSAWGKTPGVDKSQIWQR